VTLKIAALDPEKRADQEIAEIVWRSTNDCMGGMTQLEAQAGLATGSTAPITTDVKNLEVREAGGRAMKALPRWKGEDEARKEAENLLQNLELRTEERIECARSDRGSLKIQGPTTTQEGVIGSAHDHGHQRHRADRRREELQGHNREHVGTGDRICYNHVSSPYV
jgi:hypothetical protein